MAAMAGIRIPLLENLSGTPVTPSQSCRLSPRPDRPFGHDSALQQSHWGELLTTQVRHQQRKKSDISESQMTFTFTREYSDIFKAARLKKKKLLEPSDIPSQEDYLLMGVLVSGESSTAAPFCHILETL